MKKIILVLLLALLFGCDDIPDDVVESSAPDYQVVSLDAPDVVTYNGSDVAFDVSVEFEDITTISSVWFDIVDEEGSSEIISDVSLSNTSGNIYSGTTALGSTLTQGKYILEVFVEDNQRNDDENTEQVVSHTFQFYTSTENYAPVISNLNLQDEVIMGEEFFASVEVSDSNGLTDIDMVYCEIFEPDGSQFSDSTGAATFLLADDGDTDGTGDEQANDGVYTTVLKIPNGYSEGDWTVRFMAIDNSGLESNELEQTLTTISANVPPVLSNLSIADTVSFGTQFTFSVEVSDSNGLSDVDSVYYEIYRPDGTQISNSQGISKFPLSDNGDTSESGDIDSGDGIYTNVLTIPSGYPSGDWKMEFTAVDNSGTESNQIIHTLTVR